MRPFGHNSHCYLEAVPFGALRDSAAAGAGRFSPRYCRDAGVGLPIIAISTAFAGD
jgi:hypothetical protein